MSQLRLGAWQHKTNVVDYIYIYSDMTRTNHQLHI